MGYGENGPQYLVDQFEGQQGIDKGRGQARIFQGIFCLCEVSSSSEAQELLMEGSFELVETIACLVHKLAYEAGGTPMNRAGDRFLLIWKFKAKSEVNEPRTRAYEDAGQ